ncbi:MAG: alpha/beta hydrolase [Pseudomonadota bacterium]
MAISDRGLLRVGKAELEYRMIGPPPDKAPTLVLLHEGLGCVAMWRDFPDRLADRTGYGVFAYSRQGYGGSSPCAVPRSLNYMHDEAERVLPVILDTIGFREGALIGHSDGASIAAIYGGSARDVRLRGLVLIAPHFFTEAPGLASIAEAKRTYESGDLRQRLAKHHGDNVDCAFWGWNRAWLDPGFRQWDLTGYLPGITVPLQLIQGEDDEYGTLAQIETAADRCGGPVRTSLLPKCGHSPHREQPEETLDIIGAFLNYNS